VGYETDESHREKTMREPAHKDWSLNDDNLLEYCTLQAIDLRMPNGKMYQPLGSEYFGHLP
jgi:hypothetical protein